MATGSAAAGSGLFKFLRPRLRPQSDDIAAAAAWGVAATTGALWLIQVWQRCLDRYYRLSIRCTLFPCEILFSREHFSLLDSHPVAYLASIEKEIKSFVLYLPKCSPNYLFLEGSFRDAPLEIWKAVSQIGLSLVTSPQFGWNSDFFNSPKPVIYICSILWKCSTA